MKEIKASDCKWRSVELESKEAELFKAILNYKQVKYESSECNSMIHFEIYSNEKQAMKLTSILWILFDD